MGKAFRVVGVLIALSKCSAFLIHARHTSNFRMVSAPVKAQFGSECVSLFNNMKTPASILVGALVGLGINAPLALVNPDGEEESRFEKTLRRMYSPIVVLSLSSQLISIMWSTVTVNKLIETDLKSAQSVWHLIQRDFDLAWAGTNAHFTAGMLGFIFLVGCRAYFQLRGGVLGRSCGGLALSGLLLMVSILNRGISMGSGNGIRYGNSVLDLWSHYIVLLFKQAFRPGSFGPLEVGAILGFAISTGFAVRGLFLRFDETERDTKK